jgi:hypothetical protein
MKSDLRKPMAKAKRLQKLAEQFAPRGKKGGWQAIAGKAAGDDLFRAAMKLGAQWRRKANAVEK